MAFRFVSITYPNYSHTKLTSDMSVSLPQKSSSTLRFIRPTSSLLCQRLLTVSSNNPPSMSAAAYTRLASCCLRDHVMLKCPQNIVLSGGSTMFTHFGQRLKRDLKQIVDRRIEASETLSGSHIRVCLQMDKNSPVVSFIFAVNRRGGGRHLPQTSKVRDFCTGFVPLR